MKNNISEDVKSILINYLAGSITEDDAEKLRHWLESDLQNKKLLQELRTIWYTSSLLQDHQQYDADKAWDDVVESISEKRENKRLTFVTWRSWLQIAATFLLVLSLGFAAGQLEWRKKPPRQEPYTEVTTIGNSKVSFILSDGTEVWLNKSSKIYPSANYGDTDRSIKLEGEAYFKVAKNEKLPFMVHSSEIIITALGTEFNVCAYPEDEQIRTTLAEGSVFLTAQNKEKSITLVPNQMAVYKKSSEEFVVEDMPALCQSLWKEPKWLIRKESIAHIAKLLETRYGVAVNYKGEGLEKYTFSGTIMDEQLEDVLIMIQLSVPITYTIEGNAVSIQIDKKRKNIFKSLIY